MRPEVVAFLEAHAVLNVTAAEAARAQRRHQNAEQNFRAAWAGLTAAEKREVNAAHEALAACRREEAGDA